MNLQGLRDALRDDRPASIHPGDVLDRYRIDSVLGRGGSGVVYRARDLRLQRDTAIKVLGPKALGASRIERFTREASAAARLTHPDIVKIYELGAVDGIHYISMEYVKGVTLADLLAKGRRDPRELIRLIERVARAVQYAHDRGVIHRDLKPQNILLRADGRPTLTDFGLAKIADRETHLTRTGFVLGTPLYMSPEQVRGTGRVDGRTDVYSLGVMLYEGLTGRLPFYGTDPGLLYNRIMEEEPKRPRSFVPSLPAELDWIVLKCLHKNRARRYARPGDLADDLTRFLRQDPVAARPESRSSVAFRFLRKHRLAISAGLFFCLAVGGVFRAVMESRRADELEARLPAPIPFDAASLRSLGLKRQNQGDYRGAIEALTRAIELDPNSAESYYARGSARTLVDDLPRAEEDFTRAIELDPSFPHPRGTRGNIRVTMAIRAVDEVERRRLLTAAIRDLEHCLRRARGKKMRTLTERRLEQARALLKNP